MRKELAVYPAEAVATRVALNASAPEFRAMG